jgi:hypothetical protein
VTPTALALIVAAVTGGAGIVQGLVQGILTSRSASVGARQEAARAGIDLCDRLMSSLAAMGQAANEYSLRVDDAGFLDDWDAREGFVHKILTTHGQTLGAATSLPADSSARGPVDRAMKVCTQLPEAADPSEILRRWKADNKAIPAAFEAVGRERARQFAMLEAATQPWWVRKRSRGVRLWALPFTSKRRKEFR